jgi:hypothetical protein
LSDPARVVAVGLIDPRRERCMHVARFDADRRKVLINGTGSVRACACRVAAASIRSAGHAPSGVETSAKLTLLPDHSVGADQTYDYGRDYYPDD